jgi:hypothetical protein
MRVNGVSGESPCDNDTGNMNCRDWGTAFTLITPDGKVRRLEIPNHKLTKEEEREVAEFFALARQKGHGQ